MTAVEKLAKEHYPEYYSAGLGVDRIGFERGYNLAKETQLPQQEISDEEIEKAAKECTFEDLDISVGSFELGAKWYREQLRNKK